MFDSIVRRGTLTAVIVLMVCIVGIVAALRIPVQMIPDLEVRTITVRTNWRGATPQDIEKEILIEQEQFLRNIPSLNRLMASSTMGRAQIEMEFPYDVDITETLIHVNNALNQVPSYPENVDQPRIYATSFSANSFMYFRITPLKGNPRDLDLHMMRDFIDQNVRIRLETVPGVSRIQLWSGAERQIQVLLNPATCARRSASATATSRAARSKAANGGSCSGPSGGSRMLPNWKS